MPSFTEDIFRSNDPSQDLPRPVLVKFESVSEWSRALEMIRCAEVDQDKARPDGGQSLERAIWTRLL